MLIKPTNKLQRSVCKDWDEFIRIVRSEPILKNADGKAGEKPIKFTLYRGHSNRDWPLHSSLERHLAHDSPAVDGPLHDDHAEAYRSASASILKNFKRAALTIDPALVTHNEVGLWQVGRHHGLLTPLLDWTESPYVAAHFAFEEWYSLHEYKRGRGSPITGGPGHCRVWAIHVADDSLERKSEFEIHCELPLGARRQIAQRGGFTQLYSPSSRGVEGYLRQRKLLHLLHAIDIPRRAFMPGAADLERMNINPLTLFPDVEGAARHANISFDGLRRWRRLHDFATRFVAADRKRRKRKAKS